MSGLPGRFEDKAFGTAEDQAAQWFVRRRDGIGQREESEFAAWLEADSAHRAAYDDLCRGWEVAREAATHPAICAMRSEALMIRPRPLSRWPAIAAGIAALLVAVGGGYSLLRDAPSAPGPRIAQSAPAEPRLRILQTAIGERTSVTLDDNSVVTLNTNSRLQVAYTPTSRNVTLLAGQVLFSVAKDKARPFIVTAGDRQVIAVGTEFEVRLEKSGVSVALLEGLVDVRRVAQGGHRADPQKIEPVMHLEAGEELMALATGPTTVKAADVEARTNWRLGRVRFDDTPLGEAVAEMNRYSKRPIVIMDQRLGAIRVSGAFKTGQITSFVAALTDLFPIKSEETGEEIRLRSET